MTNSCTISRLMGPPQTEMRARSLAASLGTYAVRILVTEQHGHIDTAPIKSQPACKTSLHGFVAQTPWVCFISNLTKTQRSALPSR